MNTIKMMSFNEAKLEALYAELLQDEGYPHSLGSEFKRAIDEVILEDDLHLYLKNRYYPEGITDTEIQSIILQIKSLPTSDLYESNKQFMHWISNGFILKREDRSQKDIYIELIDYSGLNKYKIPKGNEFDTIILEDEQGEIPKAEKNKYRFVTQQEIVGSHKRIPDGILYINGLPLVVFEFKSAVREEATIHNAYEQLTIRYRRDIPKLFLYNAFCVISDGVNSKAGSVFTNYGNFYAWRRIVGMEKEVDGIDSMYTMIQGMFNRKRLRDIIRNFIYFPDNSKSELKIVTRYPQYYAAKALFKSIQNAQKPEGDGKGGVYFGATGSGKSYTMVFLARMLMKSEFFGSPTLVMITDRTDLDDQLSELFIKSKNYIGDDTIVSVESRADLREKLQNRPSGGVFLTTIHKFTEDTELLSERTNIICISDEAHRSQTNLDQKVRVIDGEVTKTYGFAKYLHDSLPNATYVGFTGTPIDATLDVFGEVVDAYTMKESVADEITVSLVYEGRAAKVALHNDELKKIEEYYEEAAELGANEHQIEQSKRDVTTMYTVLGDPKRLRAVAEDFIQHYEKRLEEGATVIGKAMFVCANRYIAYGLYKEILSFLGSRSSRFEPITTPPFTPNLTTPSSTHFESNISLETSAQTTPSSSHSNANNPFSQYYTKNFGSSSEWYGQELPHRHRKDLLQFITFRLADSMPQTVLKEIESELKHLTGSERDITKRKKHQYWLDKGLGSCALSKREMAQKVQDALFHHNGKKYDLIAWSIMPNHVHVLIKSEENISKIVQSWKSFTGKWALKNNKKYNLGLDEDAKAFWMEGYWDRFIRDEQHFNNTVRYTLNNPDKARLPKDNIAYLYRGELVTNRAKQELHPTQVKLVMTRGKDDEEDLYNLLGTKEDRKELDREFKDPNSNFKIAIVVDMWLTGFDVPFLDTIYIDKPIKEHNLIQTISRVNRKYTGKEKGLVVDYIGIRKYMNQALRKYGPGGGGGAEGIEESVIAVKNHLDLLAKFFYKFDDTGYFQGNNREQLDTLNKAAEFAQITKKEEKRFMDLVKRLKAAYDICVNSEEIAEKERDYIHFYLAVRSIIFKLNKGYAPDTAQMNERVREMIQDALESEGVEEIFKIGQEEATQDIFDEKYLEMIDKVKLPNTKIKLLQKLLAKAIGEIKKVNRMRGIDFSKQMEAVVQRYNDRKDDTKLQSAVYDEIAETLTNMIFEVKKEFSAGEEMGIDFEEKAFYDILKGLCIKYSFTYPEDKMIDLAKEVKKIVDSKVKYPDWNTRDDIKSELKVHIIIKLDEFGYPPVERDEVYVEIFEQAENYKKHH